MCLINLDFIKNIDWNASGNYFTGIIALLIALFGTKVKDWYLRVKLEIEDINIIGEVAKFVEGGSAYFYHIKIVNKSIRAFIEKCSLSLVKVELFNSMTGKFEILPLTVPRYYQFAPSELYKNEMAQDFSNEIFIDFGRVQSNQKFSPGLISPPLNVELGICPHQKIRYHLELSAKNYRSKKRHIYEVSWDGHYEFPENPQIMKDHLTIKRIN